MMKPQPMIVLSDVESGSRWFVDVLGLRSAHGGKEYEMLMDGDELVLQLHHWSANEHPEMGDPDDPSRGNGVLVWFVTDDFEAQVARVQAAKATIDAGPLYNEGARQHEVWLRGPEGYRVVVAGPRQPRPST